MKKMLHIKPVKARFEVYHAESDNDFVQLAFNYAALDVRRLKTIEMPQPFLLAHALIESELTVILDWCTWPTLQQYAGAQAMLA